MDAKLRLNNAISANTRAAAAFCDQLQGLADSAHDMGMDRLAGRLLGLRYSIEAQAAHVDRMYSESLHEEFDQSIGAIVQTINAALGESQP